MLAAYLATNILQSSEAARLLARLFKKGDKYFTRYYHYYNNNYYNHLTALDFLRDNPGKQVPKETFTHSHQS